MILVAYLSQQDINLIFVDWESYAYTIPDFRMVNATQEAGYHLAYWNNFYFILSIL